MRSAVFTTFNFDPGFFELQVLPLLFSQSFSQVDKVRLLQLEDALRDVDHLAVYYDRGALSQDAEPARLDYRRVDGPPSDRSLSPQNSPSCWWMSPRSPATTATRRTSTSRWWWPACRQT